jgi:hypothetical protein
MQNRIAANVFSYDGCETGAPLIALTTDFHSYAPRQANAFRTVKLLSISAIGILTVIAILRKFF